MKKIISGRKYDTDPAGNRYGNKNSFGKPCGSGDDIAHDGVSYRVCKRHSGEQGGDRADNYASEVSDAGNSCCESGDERHYCRADEGHGERVSASEPGNGADVLCGEGADECDGYVKKHRQ